MTPKPVETSSGAISTAANDADERLAYIALALIPGIGARRLGGLLSLFGSARAVLSAPAGHLRGSAGLNPELASAVSATGLASVERLIAEQREQGSSVHTPADHDFPAMLRSIPDPPVLLWSRGDVGVLERPAVAIVGSRDHTAYGARIAAAIGKDAALAGIVVVSGMARGLDAVAHTAALDAGCPTIGVIANGVDIVYPLSNKPLYDRVYRQGLVLSEHPPGEHAFPGAFPRRNRLVSGLARALVVVEAADGSGTMLTVTSALEQGREVFSVPGPIDSATSRGTNRLIRDGATLLLEVAQLLSLYGIAPSPKKPAANAPPCTLSPTEATVFDALSEGGRHVDELALGTGLPVGTLLGALLGLELGGLAEQLPGNHYRRGRR